MDQAALKKLREDLGDDAEVMRELIGTWFVEAPRLVAQMQQALGTGDRASLHRAAHSLKSTSATFGAARLSRLCRSLEATTEKGMPPEAVVAVREIAAEWESVRVELAPHLD